MNQPLVQMDSLCRDALMVDDCARNYSLRTRSLWGLAQLVSHHSLVRGDLVWIGVSIEQRPIS